MDESGEFLSMWMNESSSARTMWLFRLKINDRGSGDEDDAWSGNRETKCRSHS